MKKFFYSLYSLVFVLAICCVGLTSCGGDDDDLGIPDTGEQGQGSGNSHLGTGQYEFIELLFKKDLSSDEVKSYMGKNYSNYDLIYNSTPESQGGYTSTATILSYNGNRSTTTVQYIFNYGKLLRCGVVYGFYNEKDFAKLQSDVSHKYNVVLEKKGDQNFSGARLVQYSGIGTVDEGNGVITEVLVDLSCHIYPNDQVSNMDYQIGSRY